MRDIVCCFNIDVGPCVGLGDVDNSVGFVEVGSVVNLEQRRVIPVDDHGGAVEIPLGSVSHASSHEGRILEDVCGDVLVDVPRYHGDEVRRGFIEAVLSV